MRKTKEEVMGLIQALPDDASLEDIQYLLYVVQKTSRGLRDVE